jgi:hypothetical protein
MLLVEQQQQQQQQQQQLRQMPAPPNHPSCYAGPAAHSLLKALAGCIHIWHCQPNVSKALGLTVATVVALEVRVRLSAPVVCQLQPAQHSTAAQTRVSTADAGWGTVCLALHSCVLDEGLPSHCSAVTELQQH